MTDKRIKWTAVPDMPFWMAWERSIGRYRLLVNAANGAPGYEFEVEDTVAHLKAWGSAPWLDVAKTKALHVMRRLEAGRVAMKGDEK